jgi:uncharacterized circularly permuted ATP-grasp superfamily protein
VVQGDDLTVRSGCVWLKTLYGLKQTEMRTFVIATAEET